jgi:acyl-CoA synthetase (AMP-forming)/AMP-acid ligase II
MDHFGGFNTFLSCFAYGGVAVCPTDRNPENVAKVIEESKANLLPTTPTFLNLLLAGKFDKQFNLSSIELITYGTEMMTAATLKAVSESFPNAVLKQTYGMSELGVLQSKSEDKNSLWVKVGGAGFNIKVIDDILWVKSKSNMIGYLNAPNPFDDDGWLCTGDEVEVDGDYIRFKGRKSEIVNVGGKKVFPSEVEGVILSFENIKDVTVYASTHPIMGQVAHAKISTIRKVETREFIERLRKFCNEKLAKYKVPVKFILTDEGDTHHNARFKKDRKSNV